MKSAFHFLLFFYGQRLSLLQLFQILFTDIVKRTNFINEFAFQPITKQQYEEIVKEATETSTKIFQEIANNMPKECVEQAINQLTPEKAKEVMDELKKTYEIDEETGTIGKHISY